MILFTGQFLYLPTNKKYFAILHGMILSPIKTEKLIPPKDNLDKLIEPILQKLEENMIVVISSKVISIAEGNCLSKNSVVDKDTLVKAQSDYYLPREAVPNSWLIHTIKGSTFIPTAGIDLSNANDYFILWPENPESSAKKIWQLLKQKTGLKNLGIVISDSHSIPMRRGLTGISIAHFGFNPLYDYRGKKDLFSRTMEVSMSNIPDSLAAASVLQMGEGAEQTPIVLISDLPASIKFVQKKSISKKEFSQFEVPMEEDLFRPFLTAVPWKKGGKN